MQALIISAFHYSIIGIQDICNKHLIAYQIGYRKELQAKTTFLLVFTLSHKKKQLSFINICEIKFFFAINDL
jgi:hypothetical protein